jgi:cofilin
MACYRYHSLITDDCIRVWNDVKIHHKHRYVLFDFSNDLEHVVVDWVSPRKATYDDFLDTLPPCDVRYAVYDYEWKADDKTIRSMMIFIVWVPEDAPILRKMLIASTRSHMRSNLWNPRVVVQATNQSEIQENVILQMCKGPPQ